MAEKSKEQEKYRKVALLGQGATAQVFLVVDGTGNRQYAMKVGKNKLILQQEARMLQQVAGENSFPEFVEYMKEENALIMEYLEGQNLQKLLNQGIRFEEEEIWGIMKEVLRALSILHRQKPGIVYRDLKPANIMLGKDGSIRLIDLGAACYVKGETGGISNKAGTYGYAAPEQFWEGVPSDITCDIYSAGKVLAYLVSGKNPLEPPYDMEHYCKRLKRVKPEIMEIISRSLSLNPAGRYENCTEMYRALDVAFHKKTERRRFFRRRRSTIIYEKCIWKSEYRRIF